uniref:Uncharacterized protein n=1 Tax=Strigamia maritima TaxID=126957 RepID=T1JFJ1_STRMM
MSTTKVATLSKSSRSLASSKTGRTQRSTKKPLLNDAFCIDLQKGSYIASLYSIFVALFTIALSIFDTYCLAMAEPGDTHYGYYVISFDFVYSGNQHVRRTLLACAVLSLLVAIPLLFTSFILLLGLRREHEQRFQPWLIFMIIFTAWRVLVILFSSVVNDLLFGYHISMLIIWILIAGVNMGTMSSLNTTHHSMHSMHSMHSSRPTTPSIKGSNSTAIA